MANHTHECRTCGGSVPCWTPDTECNDHPGDCEDCARVEREHRRASDRRKLVDATRAKSAAARLAARADREGVLS